MNGFQDNDSLCTVIHELRQPASQKILLLLSHKITAYLDT